ncbi:hypothetical protein QAD02_017757 [Eretmocerus hayati]|uniref:Uncharacterized protein n=1 Tax=Eretmocerus hayati TaxID=131215 RepID=A0ACC2PEU1_9HYME|nr:hypothetical protein QAD02_017757 [Eretmocerus hayati]
MFKDAEAGPGECGNKSSRAQRVIPRFSLRRLLYSNTFLARHLSRPTTSSSRDASTSKNKDVASKSQDVEKGDTKSNNEPSQSQFQSVDLQRTSSKGSVLSNATKSFENGTRDCPLCLIELPVEFFPAIQTCHHRSCYDCFQQYLRMEISESRVNIACPECSEPLHPNDIRMILNDQTQLEKYEDFMVRRVLAVEPDTRWCPAPDCSFAVIASGCASCPKLRCERPGCDSYFCYHCKAQWHPNQTCDAARAQRSQCYDRSSSLSFSQSDSQRRNDIKPCPRCQVLIFKMNDGSCNHMTCAVCAAEFCWLCMKEISDLHYLSPSGCTFWGKKPWSRKKKILWQLGTLVGAPVGIGLVAGIAVPAIIIGIPVWVGRKLYTRYRKVSKLRRNAYVAGGVTASILISPVLAGLAVGIGVPILLFYVYGVVPVSLCRSGGCGVSTSASGVRFEFDDENELMGALNGRNTGDAASIDVASHRGGNPSIGEASLSLGSGSQLEKLGRENDRESASNVALAGTSLAGISLAGSIASSVLPGGQRLEVQVDVTSSQRFSVCSETASATTSLSEKSVNASIAPDDGSASTVALAGSVLNMKIDGCSLSDASSSTQPPQQQMDSSSGQAASLSSLDEITPGNLAKRTRRRPASEKREVHQQQTIETSGDDCNSERVRFDHHVSFIEADQEPAPTCSSSVVSKATSRRKRSSAKDQQQKQSELDADRRGSLRSPSSDMNSTDSDEGAREQRVNVATLRNVFFHSSSVSSDRDKRLPVIEEPSTIVISAIPGDVQTVELSAKLEIDEK